MKIQTSFFPIRLSTQLSLCLARAFRKRQPTIDLAHRFDVAFAVIADLGKLSRAEIGKLKGAG